MEVDVTRPFTEVTRKLVKRGGVGGAADFDDAAKCLGGAHKLRVVADGDFLLAFRPNETTVAVEGNGLTSVGLGVVLDQVLGTEKVERHEITEAHVGEVAVDHQTEDIVGNGTFGGRLHDRI